MPIKFLIFFWGRGGILGYWRGRSADFTFMGARIFLNDKCALDCLGQEVTASLRETSLEADART